MLRKLNITLAVLALVGALFWGGMAAYSHFSNPQNSKVVEKLGGLTSE